MQRVTTLKSKHIETSITTETLTFIVMNLAVRCPALAGVYTSRATERAASLRCYAKTRPTIRSSSNFSGFVGDIQRRRILSVRRANGRLVTTASSSAPRERREEPSRWESVTIDFEFSTIVFLTINSYVILEMLLWDCLHHLGEYFALHLLYTKISRGEALSS